MVDVGVREKRAHELRILVALAAPLPLACEDQRAEVQAPVSNRP